MKSTSREVVRVLQLLPALLSLLWLSVSGCSSKDSGGRACLGGDIDGVVPCAPQAQCAQLQNEPSRKVSFILDLQSPEAPLAERQARFDCVLQFLQARGAVADAYQGEDRTSVRVVGTLEQLRPAFSMSDVRAIEVGCHSEGVCNECQNKAQAGCMSDSFCWSVTARKYQEANACLENFQFLGCLSVGVGCNDAETWSRGPRGDCWWRSDGCLPQGWKQDTTCQPAQQPDMTRFCATSTVCTPGTHQTCNDNPAISSLHGQCLPDGSCACTPPFAKNPETGRCL